MRIRKNANLSSVVFSHASEEETHVCQLNQSPWDVIPFSQLEPNPSSNHQFEVEYGLLPNGSFSDSLGAVESVASMRDEWDDKAGIINNEMPNFSNYDNDNDESEIDGLDLSIDWQCDNNNTMPKDDNYSVRKCSSFKSNTPVIPTPIKKQEKTTTAAPRRGRGKGVKNKGTTSAANPYEYYYYSGFGPKWGKRRGAITEQRRQSENVDDNKDDDSSDNTMANANQNDKSSSSSSIDKKKKDNNGGSGYMDEDTDDDDEDLDGDSKRMRKPVKARSLKSLM